MERPSWGYTTKVLEGTETEVFKLYFKDWVTLIKIDHSKHSQPDIDPQQKLKKIDVDVQAIYAKPPQEISEKQSKKFIRDTNDMMKSMQGYVLLGGNFKKLPNDELGLFYNESVYVFLCSYYVESDSESEEESEEEESEQSENIDYIIYFWQGKHASQMGWLKFKFGFQLVLENEIKRIFKKTPKVVRTEQQKEPAKLLAHFNQKIIIKNGLRPKDPPKNTKENESENTEERSPNKTIQNVNPNTGNNLKNVNKLFRMHCGLSHVHIRTIQVPLTSKSLVSSDVFLLIDEGSQTIYTWQGKGSKYTDVKYTNNMLPLLTYPSPTKYKVEIISEGQEPAEFWKVIGGKTDYPSGLDSSGAPLRPRLWRCSNSTGYFKVTEVIEFCQDDLVDDDVIFIDCGPSNVIYMWQGPRASSVEVAFSKRTVQAYLAHYPSTSSSSGAPSTPTADSPDTPTAENQPGKRTFESHVVHVQKGKEPEEFKALFIGWDKKKDEKVEVGSQFTRENHIPWGQIVF